MGLQDGLEVCTFASELSSLGLNFGPATNSHPGVSQAGRGINVCAVPRMDATLQGIPSTGVSWWTLQIPRVAFAKSRRAIADTLNKFQIPVQT